MNNPPPTLKQRQLVVTLDDGRKITVRRMYHQPARAFIKALAAHIATRVDLFTPDDEGQLRFSLTGLFARLPELVLSVDDLAAQLIAHSVDEPETAFAELDLADWLRVLQAAITLNLGAELKNSFAGIRDALAPLLAEMTTRTSTVAAPTPS